jgi:hypothetical protein
MADPPHHSFPPPTGPVDEQGVDDDTLMAQVCEGDRDAFATLIRRYGPRLAKYTTTITSSVRLGMEIAEESWLAVWGNRTRYPGDGQFIPFVLTIAKRRAGAIAKRRPAGSTPEEREVELDIEAHIAAILPRLDDPEVQRLADLEAAGDGKGTRRRPTDRRWIVLAAIGGAIVLVIAIVFVLRAAVFSRGAGGANIANDVHVTVKTTPGPRPIADSSRVEKKAEYSASYTSTYARRAYVLVFAVDAAKEVHWIAPAFTDPQQDPSAVEIERTESEMPLRSSVVFDGIAEGKLSVFAVVTERLTHVSDIERIPATERTFERLKARFKDGSIKEWKTTVVRK